MPRTEPSEIDDIFASKSKTKLAQSSVFSAKGKEKVPDDDPTAPSLKKEKKKRSKAAQEQEVSETTPASNVTSTAKAKRKRPEPETVLDPSTALPTPAKRSKPAGMANPTRPRKDKSKRVDEERFRDSRGTVPRRKTEEGYSIYKEEELRMGNEGGDTPLCPFDCDCCF